MNVVLGVVSVSIILTAVYLVLKLRARLKADLSGSPQDMVESRDVITRDDKDAYANVIWAAFDSGKPVMWSEGDGMRVFNEETGKWEKKSGE